MDAHKPVFYIDLLFLQNLGLKISLEEEESKLVLKKHEVENMKPNIVSTFPEIGNLPPGSGNTSEVNKLKEEPNQNAILPDNLSFTTPEPSVESSSLKDITEKTEVSSRSGADKPVANNNSPPVTTTLSPTPGELTEEISNVEYEILKLERPYKAKSHRITNKPSMNGKILADVVIITALTEERDAVLRYLPSYEEIRIKNQTFHKASIPSHRSSSSYQIVLISLPSMGNLEAAIAVTHAISVWNPDHIILTGITGGVPKGTERSLGDLVVGDQIIYYELGKRTAFGTTPRYQAYRPAEVLIDAAKNLPPQNWAMSIKVPRPDNQTGRVIPKIHFGVVASGEKVVADDKVVEELRSAWSEVVGVEMEAAGTAMAAYRSDQAPGFLLVKGICDWADSSKNDNWHQYAAEAAASFVVELLKSEPFKSKSRPQPQPIHRPTYSGRAKLRICPRLQYDWQDLADIFEIPKHQRVLFERGREPHGVWEWLEHKNKLSGLKEALELIGRDDLIEELDQEN